MDSTKPLYNSRVSKIYLEYIIKTYPDIDVNYILEYSGISQEEIEDQACWFNQEQVDRFQEAAITLTGDKSIARKAGRYSASSNALGIAKHYALGMLNLTSLFLLIGKLYAIFSRAAIVKGRKINNNSVEIICTPKPGISEKAYQCENRIGMFESVARLFTNDFAEISHPSCIHKGQSSCRYVIKWEKKPFILWKLIRNYSYLSILILMTIGWTLMPLTIWAFSTITHLVICLIFSLIPEYIEKKELINAIETQGNMAKDLLDEMEIRHNNSILIQEIGQAISSILDIDKLTTTIANSMKTHLDFDRGLIMLSNKDRTFLEFKAGYGYNPKDEMLLHETKFSLTNPNSKGFFVHAFKKQKPFIINNFKEIEKELSSKSQIFAKQMKAQSMICVPITYENKSLGILAVDNIKSKRSLTNSDLSFMVGVASQIAISITNAISYRKLEESKENYRDLVENANSIIMRRDASGKVTFFNKFAQKLFNIKDHDIMGKIFEETIFLNSESSLTEFKEIISSLKKQPQKITINESEIILKTGEKIWITWTYKPIFDNTNQLREILSIGNDVTELKKAETEKEELEARLQRARKMEALGTLAGGVAHDLNNILSGIVSYPELLLMDLPDDSKLRRPIITIQKSGERAAAVVQDLLTLARRGVVNRKTVQLNSLIVDYLNSPEHENLIKTHPNVKIEYNLSPKLLNIQGSPIHLTKTIMNLMSNAVEAVLESGEVIITTNNRYVDKTINGFDKVNEGHYVTLSISDNGVGISPQDLERIFEPFYTKKVMGRKSGTGLGMAVVWGTIKDHNGYIDIQSTEGVGTIFTLFFPASGNNVAHEEKISSIEDLYGNGETVLVVDDIEEQRNIAKKMLFKLGYNAYSVSGGQDALAYLNHHPADVIILDMILDGELDGLDIYKKILEKWPGQKAIIASGFSETQRVKEAQKLGARQYLKKPYNLKLLGKAIKLELEDVS